MKQKLRKYVMTKFRVFPKTREITDLRDELYSMTCDKYDDCIRSGLSPDEAFIQAKSILNGYRDAVREVETGSSLPALRRKIASSLAFSAAFFMVLTFVYLFISLITLKSFSESWLLFVGGAFLYFVYFFANLLHYATAFNMRVLKRVFLGVMYASFVPLLYVFPSLAFSVLRGINIWQHSWIIIIFIVFAWAVCDLVVFARHGGRLLYVIELILAGLLFTVGIYLCVSYIYSLWNVAWLIFVLYLCIVAVFFWIKEAGRT